MSDRDSWGDVDRRGRERGSASSVAVLIRPILRVRDEAPGAARQARAARDGQAERDPHLLVTRVLDRGELDRELDVLRQLALAEQTTSASVATPATARPPSDFHVTREMTIDEVLPPPVLGSAATEPSRSAVRLRPCPEGMPTLSGAPDFELPRLERRLP